MLTLKMMMTLPDSVLSFQAEEEAGGEVFQVINAHLQSIIFTLPRPAFYIIYTLHTPAKLVVVYTWHSCIFIHYIHLTHLQAQLHSVCTGGCIVYSTVLSSWCTITELHTMHCTEVHCTEVHCTECNKLH